MLLAWQAAVWLALLTAALAAGAGRIDAERARRLQPWLRETAVVLAMYAAWQVGLDLFASHVARAAAHGMWIWRLERAVHLPSERTVQQAALHWRSGAKALDYYYAVAHVQDVIFCLVWLFWRHREAYRWA